MKSIGMWLSSVCFATMIVAAGPPYQQPEPRVPEWKAELAVLAGEIDGPGALADVFHVELAPRGEILAVQPSINAITVFAPDGSFKQTIGRIGQGPGEFSFLSRIGWIGDTLWVMDAGRLHLWNTELQFVRTLSPTSVSPPAGVSRVVPGPVLPDGSILGIPMAFDDRERLPILIVERTGQIRGTVTHVSTTGRTVRVELSTGPYNPSNPWADHPLWLNTVDGRSIVIVTRRVPVRPGNTEIRIIRVSLDGDTLVNRAVTYAAVPLDSRARNEVIDRMAEGIARARSVPRIEATRALSRALTPPAFYPPVDQLVTGRDGTIWLRRIPPAGEFARWDVYDDAGKPIGKLSLPESFAVAGAERSRVWGTVRGDFDIPYIHVYRIVEST